MENEDKKFYQAGDQLSNHANNTKVRSIKATREHYNSPEYQQNLREASAAISVRKTQKQNMETFWKLRDLEDSCKSELLLIKELKAVRDTFRILIVLPKRDKALELKEHIQNEYDFSNIDIACSVKDAVLFCKSRQYDVILSAYNLSDVSGREFHDLLVKCKYKNNFILISGYSPAQAKNLKAAGILCFEDCSMNTEQLFELVTKLTKGYYSRKLREMISKGFDIKGAA